MLLSPKHRRLWRRRLRRRPLLPFLLAATLAVDVVLAVVLPGASGTTLVALAAQGLLIAQLALVATWCVYSLRGFSFRALAAAGFTVVLGSWFFATQSVEFAWFVFLYLMFFVATAWATHRLIRSPGLRGRSRGYGIAGLLTWTTVVGIVIAAVRSASGTQIVAVLGEPLVWVGVLVDASVLAVAVATTRRARSVRWVAVAMLTTTLLLVGGRYLADKAIYAKWESLSWMVALYSMLVPTLAYQLAYTATLLIWFLGLRTRGRTLPPRANDQPGAAHEVSGVGSLDATV